jgi:N-acylneuraminate cytidylyltransferase
MSKIENTKKQGTRTLVAIAVIGVAVYLGFEPLIEFVPEGVARSVISSSFGADIIHRPSALAQDDSSEWLAWRHAVLYVEKNFGLFDGFISLPPTSPLRNQADILGAVNLFEQTEKADICLGISESSRNPYFNMVEKSDDQSITLACKPTVPIIRRQDAPIIYDITTVIYAAAPSYIKNYDGIFAGSVIGYKIPKRRAIDIDDILDFKFAEFLYDN